MSTSRREPTGCALVFGVFLGMCLTLVWVYTDMAIACGGAP